jgi:protoheme IX farnesyltransferase
MLPVIAGVKTTKINILVYSLAMLPVVIAPYFLNFAGIFYLAISISMTLYYNYLCLKLFKTNATKTSNKIARKIFIYSIFYLFFIFLTLLVDQIVSIS